jgi:predicted metalloprotease with PDZ domain
MKSVVATILICGAACFVGAAAASPGPTAAAPAGPIAAPKDRPYPGDIRLLVDATDIERRVIRVHETVNGVGGHLVLLYPKWLPGEHAPKGPIDRLAGLTITASGVRVAWTRDPVDMHAFHVDVPAGVTTIDVDFQYLSPTSANVGPPQMSRDLLSLEWNTSVLYPAGYFARQIQVEATLSVPAGWHTASALQSAVTSGPRTTFERVSLETLLDSPVFAGRYFARLDLDPSGTVPVHADLFADRQDLLDVTAEQLERHRALVQQAYKLFGSHHYQHYDFLFALSDQLPPAGIEHHQSSEDIEDPEYFADWDKTAHSRDLLPHEYTHSWNGKFRRPADLWTPNYNVPMRNSLLWVYEGQTQYWGQVLAARSGLWTKQQALEEIALTAAYYDSQAGRKWRTLQDTTSDEIINPRRPMSWHSWQRFEDYYEEGELIWLEADTLIRERSQGKRSLDDFARGFFGIDDGSSTPVTYVFDDVVRALNSIEPYDWATFLRERLDAVDKPAPLGGLRRGGYKLVYTDTPGDHQKAIDGQRKSASLYFSVGVDILEKDGSIATVLWGSPAFKAGLTKDTQILAVNDTAYSADLLRATIKAAKNSTSPIELIVKTGDRFRVVNLDYHEGLRYPHLERDSSQPARLDDILAPRP